MDDRRPILLAGPTASGKSALAMGLAERFGGVVINADAMQVYRDLRIITARPSPDEEKRVPHLLYGHVDAAENYSVGRWLVDVNATLDQATSKGRVPIVVGGTGLYFKALTQGLATIPPIPPEIRTALRARIETEGVGALHAELTLRDAAAAQRIKPGDRTRIIRALEVVEATGRSISEWHRDGIAPRIEPATATKIFLAPDMEQVIGRIDRRFDQMIASGALEEVRALDARHLDPRLPAMKAHGVPWLRRHLHGEISLADAAAGAKRDTRAYAKRQLTWFRHQMPDWHWLQAPDEACLLDAYLSAK
jgi:tRNA dimethylallyltransferase